MPTHCPTMPTCDTTCSETFQRSSLFNSINQSDENSFQDKWGQKKNKVVNIENQNKPDFSIQFKVYMLGREPFVLNGKPSLCYK